MQPLCSDLRLLHKPESMVRMFGYVGTARVKRRLTPVTVALAATGMVCFAMAYLLRHVSLLHPLQSYRLDFRLAGCVLAVFEMWAIRRRDEQLLPNSDTEI